MKKGLIIWPILGLVALTIIIIKVASMKRESAEKVPEKVLSCKEQKELLFVKNLQELYQQTGLDTVNLSYDVFKKAMTGFYNLTAEGKVDKPILTIIDFEKPSSKKRMWIIDLDSNKLLYHSLVAHGRNTGDLTAESFSNDPNSYMSSIGFYVTSDLYNGKHGTSMRVDGMEEGWNDNAKDRAIVMHGADYVSQNFVKRVGRLGRSHGCPAIPQKICNDVICRICERSVLFIYYPDQSYLAESKYLKEHTAYEALAEAENFNCKKQSEIALSGIFR